MTDWKEFFNSNEQMLGVANVLIQRDGKDVDKVATKYNYHKVPTRGNITWYKKVKRNGQDL